MIDTVLKICGALSIVAAAGAVIYKTYRYWVPAKAYVSYTITALPDKSDSLSVSVINRSNAPIYIQSCIVRCTYSRRELLKRHLKNPFLHPRLYPNLRYNSCVYEFIGDEPVQLEPSQKKTLTLEIYEHPLNALHGPMLIALAKLTTGRTIASRRMPSPPVWRFIGRRELENA